MYNSPLGPGWTHNYEMQIHFSDNELPDSVELQTPGGNRLPFIITTTGSVTTYIPYAGVTTNLTWDDSSDKYVVTGFDQSTYRFNATGQLLEQEDPFGNIVTFVYDGQTGLLSSVSQGDHYLEYTYTNGFLTSVEDSAGRVVYLDYDDGLLTVVTDTLGLETTYTYNDTLLTSVIDPTNRTLFTATYDAEGRAIQQQDGLANIRVSADYTITDTHVITHNSMVMTHTYSSLNTLSTITMSCNDVPGCQADTNKRYDGNFKTDDVTDANNNQTLFTWSDNGSNLEQVSNALEQDTLFTYDALNSLTEIENARGYTTSYRYEDGNLLTFRTSTTNALQQTTIYTPTDDGLLEVERDPNGLVTRYWYNEYGQVTETVRAYGTADAITMTYGYDAVGRLITMTRVSPDSDPITTLNVYDAADRLIATIQNWTGTNPANWEDDCLTTSGTRDTNVCTRYGYDEAGRVISTTNTLGQTDLSFYDAAGQLYLRVGNYDGTANYENDPVGVLCDWVTPDPENNLCNLTGYDYYGRVVSTTNVLGNVDRTFYDSLGRVQATVVNSVNVTDDWEECDFPPAEADEDLCTVYTYDAVGNVVEVKDPAGRVTLTVYDELNRVEGTIVNWDGAIDLDDCYTSTWLNQTERDENVCTRYVYDEVGNTVIVSDTLGRISFTVYDELNRVAGTIGNWDGTIDLDDCWTGSLPANRDNNVCTGYLYDAVGNQTVMTNTLSQMNLTVYDTVQRPVIQVTNWDGTSTTWPDDCADTVSEPEATENLCTFTSYDSLGRRADVTNALGHVVEFAYDGLGRVITTTRYLDSQPIETTVTYDALGNRLNQTDAEDHTFTTVYDSLNRPVVSISHEGVAITTTYNAASWVMGTINNLEHTTANDYDDLGRLVVMTDGENHTTEYGYDALGNQIVMTDALGIATRYSYDELNRLISVTENETANDPDHENNLFTQYRYDVLGNRVVITNALAITSSLTVYDTLSRPVSVKDALGNETQYQYNILSQRTVMTDANGNITLYSYDDLNRLDTVSYETDNEMVEYAYDALGNRTIMTDNLGVATYQYDDFSRVITVTSPMTGTVGYRYDRVGNRVELIYPNGSTVTYQYDGDNRLVEVEDWQAGITIYEYDPVGRLITTTLPNGVVTINTYDDAHRLTTLTHEDGDSNLVASFTYKLDDVGNRAVATETLRLPLQVITETQTSPTDLSLTSYQLPAVAYNSEDDEYMVVWQGYDEGSSLWYIYGQRVGTNGALLGTDLEIVAEATEPAIAYSPEQNQYLVVWRNIDDDILGLFVDADGSIPADPFSIYDPDTNSQPDVAYNPNDTTFTVVWLSENGGKYGIIAYKVQEQGSPVEVAGEEVVLAHPAIAISSNGTQLVVWDRDDSSTGLDIMGQRLNSSGSVLGGVIALVDYEFQDDTNPAVAWNNTAGYFLVTWQERYSTLGDTAYTIEAQRVGTDGSLPGYIVTLGGGIDLDASNPDVFYSGSMWFVAWQQNPGISSADFNLYGRWLQSDGTLADETFDLITASSTQARPALAGGNASGEMLLVWEDDRNSEDAIYHAVLIPGHLETTVIAYTYDPLYRLVETDYSGAISATYEYVYDEVGNMTAYTETVGTELVRVMRSFDDANQLQTSLMLDGARLGTTSYYYDYNGNLEMMILPGDPEVVLSYNYDQRNLLIETGRQLGTGPTITTAEFSYNGIGNRVQQVDLTGSTPITTTYANDNLGLSQVLVAYAGSEETSNLFGLDLIQQDTGADTLTLLADGLGSVRLEVIEDTINTATTYDPYGNQLVQIGTSNTTYGFTGEQEDSSTGLLYLRARYYNPYLNQFQSRDPFPGYAKLPASQNGYNYVKNNPINEVDPTGMCSFQDSECRKFVRDVQFIIDEGIAEGLSDPVIVSILADYYAGFRSTIPLGELTCWMPIPTPWTRVEPTERHPVYPPEGQEANWPYDPNLMRDPNNQMADNMRAQYGFKLPYYQNTHHYFAIFYIEYTLPFIGLGSAYGRDYDEGQLQSKREQGVPAWDYEAEWIDVHYDLYVNEVAASHAQYVWLWGIRYLPQLIEQAMCANNQVDVWSLQTTVFSGNYEPDSDLAPEVRVIPIPGLP